MLDQKLAFQQEDGLRILSMIAAIDRFRGRWELTKTNRDRALKELRRIATVQSIASSTRIEGSKLSDQEVEKLISAVRITRFGSRDEEEVAGYYEALDLILENHEDIPFKESSILHLHTLLLKYSGKDERHRGKYKTLPNSVTATYPDGTRKTIFESTPPHLTPKEMEGLIAWTGGNLPGKRIHPLLVIGLFAYEFLSIHPFQDGNGRLSRLLTTLLLMGSGYDFVQYISFEHQIEARKAGYYRALMNCQQRRRKGRSEDVTEWILFFLGNLLELTEKLGKKYAGLKQRGGYTNARQKQILDFARARQPIKLADLAHEFAGTSINTLKKDLQKLVAEGLLSKSGEKKGTVYFVGESV